MTSVFRLTDLDARERRDAGLRAPSAVVEVDIAAAIQDIVVGERCATALVLTRAGGRPVGRLSLPVTAGRLRTREIGRAIVEHLPDHLLRALVRARLETPLRGAGIALEELFEPAASASDRGPLPAVTVAVCSRDRSEALARCLDSLQSLDWPGVELLLVDNAPADDSTLRLVRDRYPRVRYLHEPRPGLSVARNTALAAARGRIVAFTDDDAVVDPGWLEAIVSVFSHDARIGVVTGLVQPAELATPAQILVETHWSLDRGYTRHWWRQWQGFADNHFEDLETWRIGAGVNMAIRVDAARAAGGFDTGLGAGTAVAGGEENDFFSRVMRAGFTIVYEPAAIVWHSHREGDESMRRQVTGWVAGTAAGLTRLLRSSRGDRLRIAAYLCTLLAGELWRLVRAHTFPGQLPRRLARETFGAWVRGLVAPVAVFGPIRRQADAAQARPRSRRNAPVAVRELDLARGLRPIEDIDRYARTRVVVKAGARFVGTLEVDNAFGSVSAAELGDRIASKMARELLADAAVFDADTARRRFAAAVEQRFGAARAPWPPARVPERVSVVVPTCGRPDQLVACLRSLRAQRTRHDVEIIVVDNHPSTGEVAALASGFPEVRFLEEPRPGASRARNRGVRAARGDIIALLDDDTVAPPGWLEAIVRPFERSNVQVVTSRVLPLELETRSQQLFEKLHGLGPLIRRRQEFGPDFFQRSHWHPVPVGEVGVSANLALRRSVFEMPEIGGFEEALGPGTPAASGEDLYLLYRIAREGLTIAYEPDAYLYHRHRRSPRALRRQLYEHGKAHTAFHLLCLFRDGDLRSLTGMCLVEPAVLLSRLLHPRRYPASLVLARALGGIVGPLSLVRSLLAARRPRVAEITTSNGSIDTAGAVPERSVASTD